MSKGSVLVTHLKITSASLNLVLIGSYRFRAGVVIHRMGKEKSTK